MSPRWNLACFDGRENAAIWFRSMETITESTAPFERRFESGEEAGRLECIDLDCDEILEARRIDEKSPTRKSMECGRRRRVTALPALAIEFGHLEIEIRNERVQQ